MRKREEKRAEKEQRYQEMRERKRKENRQRAMEERKCFRCGRFGHMAYNCRKVGEEKPTQVSSNRFEVLKIRVMQREKGGSKEVAKDRKEILREEKAKRGVDVMRCFGHGQFLFFFYFLTLQEFCLSFLFFSFQ